MAVSEPIPTKALDEGKRIKLLTQAVNEMLIGEDSTAAINGGRTEAEIAAGVVPASLAYPPGNVRRYGAVGNGTTDDTGAFQDAIDSLPAQGGRIDVPEGDYNVTPGSLTTGNKAVTWVADKATLPDDMPGVAEAAGVYTLPETSFQSDKDVRVHDMRVIDETQATVTLRQYGLHIQGYMSDGASNDVREVRAFSFDLGTNETYNQADIRGIKGRVYADGGDANVRAIYGFAEGFNSHTGDISGLIGTVNRETGCTGQAVAVRGHIGPDDATSNSCAAFQAASNGSVPVQVSYAYGMRAGSNALLPTQSCFLAHGGGTGDMYRGIRTHLVTDVTYSVDNAGRSMGRSFYSGRTTIADDSTASITVSTSSGSTGGILIIWMQEVSQMFGMAFFRVNSSPFIQSMSAGTLVTFTTGDLTGTTGTDGRMTVSAKTDGTIEIENRQGASREVCWMLLHDSAQQGNLS